MDCMCEVVFQIGKHGCLIGSFLLQHIHHIGIFVLFAICLIITLIRVLDLDENYGMRELKNLSLMKVQNFNVVLHNAANCYIYENTFITMKTYILHNVCFTVECI